MGLLDDASGLLDAATGGKSTSTAAAEARFELKEFLSTPEQGDFGSFGISYDGQDDNPNPLDGGITTEFIHFGKVHPDTGKKFPHNDFNPVEAQTPPEGHAIMFRDALEREAIALFGFVSSTKLILKEATENRSGLEEVGAMAANLLGGGNSQSKPDPTQLDTFLSDIESAVQTINKAEILYPEIHEAGKKLHETRATYVAFCTSLNDFYIKPPEGNPMDMAAGALANLPGVGNIMATVQRFAFKWFDLYLAAYLKLRENHEKSIEDAAHDLTIAAIKKDFAAHNPTYPIWFKKAPQRPEEEEATEEDEDNLLADVNKKIDEAKKKVEDTKKAIEKEADKVYGFLGMTGNPEKTPGSEAIAKIFTGLKGSPETDPGAIPSGSACLIDGMDAAMQDIKGIPPFVKKVMGKINDANVGMLEEIYARLMAKDISAPIDSQLLLGAGRRHLSQKIVSIMGDLAGGLLPGGSKDFSMDVPGTDKKIGAQQFIAKLIEDKLIHFVDPIIKYAIGDLGGQLEASRQKAKENKAQTMEVLLGRLPWLTALMFRNTFFPIWNLVVEKVFETVSPQIAKVVKEVNSVFEKAKDKVDTVSDYQHRAENVQEAASGEHDLIRDDVAGAVKTAAEDESEQSKARKAQREQAAREKQQLEDFYKPNDKDEKFPVTARIANGKGEKVTEDVPPVPTDADPPATNTPAEAPASNESPIPPVPSVPSVPSF